MMRTYPHYVSWSYFSSGVVGGLGGWTCPKNVLLGRSSMRLFSSLADL